MYISRNRIANIRAKSFVGHRQTKKDVVQTQSFHTVENDDYQSVYLSSGGKSNQEYSVQQKQEKLKIIQDKINKIQLTDMQIDQINSILDNECVEITSKKINPKSIASKTRN